MSKENSIQELERSIQEPATLFSSKLSNKGTFKDESMISKASYLKDSDNVHKLNQLKELRLSLNKLRHSNDTSMAEKSTAVARDTSHYAG